MTKKFMISIMAIVLTLVALGASTYAWFSLQKVNSVGQIEMTVGGSEGLEISLDGVHWYDNLTSDVINDYIDELVTAGLDLKDVTTLDGLHFSKREERGDSFEEAKFNKDYLALTFYFRVTASSMDGVYLVDKKTETTFGEFFDGTHADIKDEDNNSIGSWITSEGVMWKSDAIFQNESSETINYETAAKKYYASEAARLAFIPHTIANDFCSYSVENGLVYNVNPDLASVLLTEVEVSAVAPSGTTLFDFTASPTRGYGYAYGAIKYYNAKNPRHQIAPLEATDPTPTYKTSLSDSGICGKEADTVKSQICVATEQTVGLGNTNQKIGAATMILWLEGWDADCFDAIFKDNIRVNLEFKLAEKKA